MRIPSLAVSVALTLLLGGDRRAPAADSPLPPWLVPGARVTWVQGSASIPSAGQVLELDEHGTWKDATGRRYAVKDYPSTSGGGLHQQTVVAADDRGVAVESRTFVFADASLSRVTSGVTASILGTRKALADYWIHPDELRARPDGTVGGVVIRRSRYPLEGRTFDAISFDLRGASSFQRSTYDLETGLLLVGSTSSVGRGSYAPNPNGTSAPVTGVTTLTTSVLRGVRTLRLPWIGDPRPAAAGVGSRWEFRGSYSTAIPGSLPLVRGVTSVLEFGAGGAAWASAKLAVRVAGVGGVGAEESVTDRVYGATTFPAWLTPERIGSMQKGQVVDVDAFTGFRTTVLGVRRGFAWLVEEGPLDRVELGFDPATGLLARVVNGQQAGLGRTELRLERAR